MFQESSSMSTKSFVHDSAVPALPEKGFEEGFLLILYSFSSFWAFSEGG